MTCTFEIIDIDIDRGADEIVIVVQEVSTPDIKFGITAKLSAVKGWDAATARSRLRKAITNRLIKLKDIRNKEEEDEAQKTLVEWLIGQRIDINTA